MGSTVLGRIFGIRPDQGVGWVGYLALDRTRGGGRSRAFAPQIPFCRFYRIRKIQFCRFLPGPNIQVYSSGGKKIKKQLGPKYLLSDICFNVRYPVKKEHQGLNVYTFSCLSKGVHFALVWQISCLGLPECTTYRDILWTRKNGKTICFLTNIWDSRHFQLANIYSFGRGIRLSDQKQANPVSRGQNLQKLFFEGLRYAWVESVDLDA